MSSHCGRVRSSGKTNGINLGKRESQHSFAPTDSQVFCQRMKQYSYRALFSGSCVVAAGVTLRVRKGDEGWNRGECVTHIHTRLV